MTSQHNRPPAYLGALASADDKESDSPGQRRCTPDVRTTALPRLRGTGRPDEVSWC
ncbi:hypothetical protein [Kocuria sp.]|uniref:hypothetical protein n=1 Tax=Kocuria sp. TaxID=1871328 RepID=UPI0026DC3581|nr:hypothetical protein [Kocuria sp.]MDO4918974.1 hypothetical protein [Kocuria sp.]